MKEQLILFNTEGTRKTILFSCYDVSEKNELMRLLVHAGYRSERIGQCMIMMDSALHIGINLIVKSEFMFYVVPPPEGMYSETMEFDAFKFLCESC